MQFNASIFLAIVMAAVAVNATHDHHAKHEGGDREYSYDRQDTDVDVKDVNTNSCGVTQAANCCNSVKHGSDEHNEWTKRHEHLRNYKDDGDYLDCEAQAASSTGGCSGTAQPFCCNATGSKLSILNCTPITVAVPVSGVNDAASGLGIL